jgi:predicted small lipoprotein YifL
MFTNAVVAGHGVVDRGGSRPGDVAGADKRGSKLEENVMLKAMLGVFALLGVFGLAACGDGGAPPVEQPPAQQAPPPQDPAVTPPPQDPAAPPPQD